MMSFTPQELSDDRFLLQEMEEGNEHAFNSLFEKYWDKAFNEAFKRLKDYDQSKDIVQEIFAHIWIKRESLQIENLPGYLTIAIRNKVFKALSKQKLIHPSFSILESMSENTLKADADLLTKEFFLAYEDLVNTLPPRRQTIFRLRIQEELYTKDIAKQLGLSRKTVQNQLGKAIEQLRISLFHLRAIIILMTILYK